MPKAVAIYGKSTCPYTNAARKEFAQRGYEVRYLDVKADPAAMGRFLELSGGDRRVPLIEEGGKVTVGFGGS